MKTLRRCFSFLLIGLFLMGSISQAAITTATSTGNWSSSGIWDNGVPTCGDTVIINPSVTVTISSHVNLDETSSPACSTAMFLSIKGILKFSNGKKLYIPCGSSVFIEGGGTLQKGTGGGNSNLIDVCGSTIWNAGDGNLSGPQWVGAPLPITLEFFQAKNASDAIELSWATQSEINNDYFTIERSGNLTNVDEILKVSGAGNSRNRLEYKELDFNPPSGQVYYRLKQTDFDGSFTYSQWVSTRVDNSLEFVVKVFPTFTEDRINIRVDNALNRSGEMFIFNSQGALLYNEKFDIISDAYVWSNANNLNHQGLLYVKVRIEGKEFAERLFYSKN